MIVISRGIPREGSKGTSRKTESELFLGCANLLRSLLRISYPRSSPNAQAKMCVEFNALFLLRYSIKRKYIQLLSYLFIVNGALTHAELPTVLPISSKSLLLRSIRGSETAWFKAILYRSADLLRRGVCVFSATFCCNVFCFLQQNFCCQLNEGLGAKRVRSFSTAFWKIVFMHFKIRLRAIFYKEQKFYERS